MSSQNNGEANGSASGGSETSLLAGFGPNEWIVEDMYQKYLADPSSVDPAWHDFFADYKPVNTDSGQPERGASTASSNGAASS
ncbi:MAG: hypothetical protein WCA46_27515, partial [Actinocatenispora sp.]